jgi:hypothetical protein
VTEHSDALTLDKGVFTLKDPRRIASSLRRSALRSRRRKADPFRSALSMLNFYINCGYGFLVPLASSRPRNNGIVQFMTR